MWGVSHDCVLQANQYHHHNDCLCESGDIYSNSGGCAPDTLKTTVYQTWSNTFYTPAKVFATTCGLDTFAEWQAHGQDRGSKLVVLPDTETILGMIKSKLGGPQYI